MPTLVPKRVTRHVLEADSRADAVAGFADSRLLECTPWDEAPSRSLRQMPVSPAEEISGTRPKHSAHERKIQGIALARNIGCMVGAAVGITVFVVGVAKVVGRAVKKSTGTKQR